MTIQNSKRLGQLLSELIVVSGLVLLLLWPRLNQPFWGNHEFNGVYYGQIARNYSRYGLVETKGGQVNNLYPSPKEEWNFHVNHPATYPLILFGVVSLMGESEISLRLVSVIASALGMIFLVRLVAEFYEDRSLWPAVLPIMLTPLFLYYGAVPVFEPILFPVVMFGIYSYWKGRRSEVFFPTVVASFGAMMIDWPGYWLALWLVVIELLIYRRRRFLFAMLGSILLATGLILFHQKIITGSFLTDLLSVGGFRLGGGQPFAMSEWVKTLLLRARAFWGVPIILVSIFGLLASWKLGRDKKIFLFGVLGMGVSHIVVFRSITWYHDYMLYHTIIVVGLLMGGVFFLVLKRFGNKAGLVLVLVVSVLTVMGTSEFYWALVNQRPFRKCVEIGRQVAESEEVLEFEVTSEEVKSCPPFVGYYGDRPFILN